MLMSVEVFHFLVTFIFNQLLDAIKRGMVITIDI